MQPDRLREALEQNEARVRAYFRRRCRNPQDVEDLVQECLLAVLSSHHRFAARSSVQTWIYAICRNVYRHHVYYAVRDAAIARKLEEHALAGRRHAEGPDDPRSGMIALLEALTPRERALYRLYYVEARPVLQIARILGRPAGTVKYLLYRLRGHVRALVAQDARYGSG